MDTVQLKGNAISIVNFKSIPVVTTAMLADFYMTDTDNIKQNYSRNKARFIEGKHFFKIVGEDLKKFVGGLKSLTNDLQPSQRQLQISPKTRVLMLWTERGAARHAKMLDTDQAWDVFEQLEECYFHRKEILSKTHKSERTALHEAHALLVTKTKHLNVSDAWKIIHQKFNVNSIEDIPYDVIPVAVEYVHHLIALYSNAEKKQFNEAELQNLHALATHMIWVREWWREFGDSIKKLNPTMYYRVNDNFKDGAFVAWWFVKPDQKKQLEESVKSFNWLTGAYQKNLPI
ncbi:ORF6N domain-containing protein [Acinetobacter wuhouensis]|uniref:ORF6N domain-containing protein n=1 Tax=Acinetobacter wuhouensis TaxID=1879050 RepID=UPI000A330A4A|nr:ORF6N domain-containing protein [Acinetobacter wuhouensis]AXQ22596.1 ORF6N domain-containing protein [Acinetobacter wuhouensis]